MLAFNTFDPYVMLVGQTPEDAKPAKLAKVPPVNPTPALASLATLAEREMQSNFTPPVIPSAWDAIDWQAYFEERAAIAEHDGELSLADAEAQAFECCVSRWLADHPPIRLATIGSTRVGGLYCDGSGQITLELDKAVDAIARDMRAFHIGRFDVRYESLAQLRSGTGFTIMEVNGSGSEAIHAWDPKYSIAESYSIIFAKQRLLFAISEANRRKGHEPIGLRKLAKLHFHQQKLIKRYPLSN